jgi:serine/threonine protein kinase/tetratricopeptide (TPR) repeat protein
MDACPSERSIFESAVDKKTSAERAAYLHEACGSNEALRKEIEALLAVHERLENPNAELPGLPVTADVPSISERPGVTIGPYKLLEQIGEGGFGVIFMAEQQAPIRRKVAVKVLKPGMDTRQVVARFEAERQALALMDHPHIARVLDAGATVSGRPYFVMELVRGIPITDYCDQNHLSPRDRLALFVHICQAVQHAHLKGIIHRDIKPSNVLVTLHDGVPVVKVIDFGIAKAMGQQLTDKTLFTGFAQMIGTPVYMSPEQAEMSGLDVDTRTDIYSLGVLLYELLTGTTPFDKNRLTKAGYDEMRRIIREEEPPKPSTRISTLARAATTIANQRKCDPKRLREFLRGDLDWIVMRALEKDRTRRYETAGAFAADVQRYLKDEPVEACPPSFNYRARKFVRRNRLALALATTIAAGLVLALVTLAISNTMVRAERDNAQREFERAEVQHARAQAVIKFLTEDLLGQASPELNSREKKITVEELLDRAAKQIDSNPKLTSQPEIEATIRLALGDAYFKLGVLGEAGKYLRRAVELRRTALGSDDPDTLAAQEALAWFLIGGLRRAADGEQLAKDTWEARGRVLGPEHRDTLDSMDTYASALSNLGRLDESEALTRQCWELRRRAFGPEDSQTLMSHGNLGYQLIENGKFAEAEKLLRDMQEILRRQKRLESEGGLSSRNNLAYALLMLGQLEEAEQLLRSVLDLARRRYSPEHPHTLHLQHLLTRVLFEQGRYPEARDLGTKTLKKRRETLTPGHENIGRSLLVLGAIGVESKQPGEAEAHLREAVKLFRDCCAAKTDLVGEAEFWLGACLARLKRHDDAEPLLLAGYDKIGSARGISPKQKERALGYIVGLYESWNKPDRAAQWRLKQRTSGS